MTSLIVTLSLILALTATSTALSCTQCSSTSSTCSGSNTTCPSGSLCGSVYTRGLTEGVRTETLIRGCAPLSDCNFIGTMSTKEGLIEVGISCCSTDCCTPILHRFPTRSPNLNGVTCRSCVSAQSTHCNTSDTIQCTGNENMCVLQTTEKTGFDNYGSVSTAARGCTTKSVCDLGSLSYNIGGSSIRATFTCSGGGISAYKVLLTPVTPVTVCLLLLKFLL